MIIDNATMNHPNCGARYTAPPIGRTIQSKEMANTSMFLKRGYALTRGSAGEIIFSLPFRTAFRVARGIIAHTNTPTATCTPENTCSRESRRTEAPSDEKPENRFILRFAESG